MRELGLVLGTDVVALEASVPCGVHARLDDERLRKRIADVSAFLHGEPELRDNGVQVHALVTVMLTAPVTSAPIVSVTTAIVVSANDFAPLSLDGMMGARVTATVSEVVATAFGEQAAWAAASGLGGLVLRLDVPPPEQPRLSRVS
ncbi:hypothetical protein [Roseomonas genomospecies 6]|uniref:Uncharacterized protein n=1 Tax=Roseomonas genomospecies 6 TaxID=214106 RepID=A0A9W7NET1_9PROT|nr:hypothetical protein [Roseomonas genomospecies 6]KAA0675828.1 hypothetical protein DS843_29815 [Roseomonas genomospecies 6]